MELKKNRNVVAHKRLCIDLNNLYEQKNKAYGNSFGSTYKKLGIISAVTRITDKYNRLVTLAKNTDIDCGDESIRDTLIDMANYCLMTVMEFDKAMKRAEKQTIASTPCEDDTNGYAD